MSTDTQPRVFFVIPGYNEAASVAQVVRQVCSRFLNVVVVDDGSSDGTARVAADAGATVVRHLLNRGQGAALKTGIEYALLRGADAIVTFDADGQHRLEDVDAMLAPVLANQCDIVLGSRFLAGPSGVPFMRRLTLKLGVIFTLLVSNIRVSDTHNGLRVFSRQAAQQIRINQDRMAHASEILDEISRLKLRYREMPTRILYTEYSKRKGQRSAAAFRVAWDFFVGKSDN
jgi:glycosyltransferase involved in cell wall biosynthesis